MKLFFVLLSVPLAVSFYTAPVAFRCRRGSGRQPRLYMSDPERGGPRPQRRRSRAPPSRRIPENEAEADYEGSYRRRRRRRDGEQRGREPDMESSETLGRDALLRNGFFAVSVLSFAQGALRSGPDPEVKERERPARKREAVPTPTSSGKDPDPAERDDLVFHGSSEGFVDGVFMLKAARAELTLMKTYLKKKPARVKQAFAKVEALDPKLFRGRCDVLANIAPFSEQEASIRACAEASDKFDALSQQALRGNINIERGIDQVLASIGKIVDTILPAT